MQYPVTLRRPSEAVRGRYHIATWGCQMNVHDTEKLAGILEGRGYTPASGADDADVILLNTCSVREKASEKFFSELNRLRPLKQGNSGLVLGVCGCVAQQEGGAILQRAPYVDFVIGPRSISSLGPILDRIVQGDPDPAAGRVDTQLRNDSIRFPFEEIRREGLNRRKAFVTVVEGCNHRCSYCIVPTTRGKEVCRDMGEVLDEVRHLAARDVAEIEFLGQTVNAYRDGAGNRLEDLIVSASGVEGIRRVRFTTSHPAQMTTGLMDAMAEASPVVCPYLHLPVQSGSTSVLRDMKRGYRREGYLRKIEQLRSRIPDIVFGTDIIVGFPTETDADFRQTLSLLDEVRFDTCYSFAYSPRPGTGALALGDGLPQEGKMDRLAELQEHQKAIQERLAHRWIDRTVEVLVEGPSKRDAGEWTGRTPENRVVNFAGPSGPGRFEDLKIVRSTAFSLRGRPAAGEA